MIVRDLLKRFWPYLLGGAIVIGAWAYADRRGYQRGAGDVQADWNAAKAEAAEQARQQEQANRAEEQRRHAAQQEAIDAKDQEIAAARRDADDARAAGDELRVHINRLTAACRAAGDPAVAAGGAPADTTANLLADVQRRLDEAAEGIARHADEASASGRACERSYDALMKPDE